MYVHPCCAACRGSSSDGSLVLTGKLADKIRLHVAARRAKAAMTACVPSYLLAELASGVRTARLTLAPSSEFPAASMGGACDGSSCPHVRLL